MHPRKEGRWSGKGGRLCVTSRGALVAACGKPREGQTGKREEEANKVFPSSPSPGRCVPLAGGTWPPTGDAGTGTNGQGRTADSLHDHSLGHRQPSRLPGRDKSISPKILYWQRCVSVKTFPFPPPPQPGGPLREGRSSGTRAGVLASFPSFPSNPRAYGLEATRPPAGSVSKCLLSET